tara:strand:- start:15 stop:638 length:624 start_codon:yes stop_codon:yes gene_type:complete
MAISTYTELKAAIADFLNREDLTAVIPTFITLAEADFNRKVRHWRMEGRSEATIDTQYSGIPADWLETIRFNISTTEGTRGLELISHSEMADRRGEAHDESGIPKFYSMSGGQFEVLPAPDGDYTADLLYYQSIEALSGSNATNWLLTYHPDAYLYTALLHSAPYLDEDQRATTWAALTASAIDNINTSSDRSRFSGTGLKMKIRSY